MPRLQPALLSEMLTFTGVARGSMDFSDEKKDVNPKSRRPLPGTLVK
ncbi:MAG: hypothetical protein ABI584_06535 [Acidobacteriota bacterium]